MGRRVRLGTVSSPGRRVGSTLGKRCANPKGTVGLGATRQSVAMKTTGWRWLLWRTSGGRVWTLERGFTPGGALWIASVDT